MCVFLLHVCGLFLCVCDYKYEFIKRHVSTYDGGEKEVAADNDDNDCISFLLLL